MAITGTAYYPSGTAPYSGTYYYGGWQDSYTKLDVNPRKSATGNIVDRSKLWVNSNTRAFSRLKISYTITGESMDMTVYLQMARDNGVGTHWTSSGTCKTYFDGVLTHSQNRTFNGTERENRDCGVIPDNYFVTVGSKSYSSLKCNSSGVFTKTIKVKATSGSTALTLSEKSAAISISGGWARVGEGTTTITDNYNNTFTITATKGANGVGNKAVGLDNLKWGYDETYPYDYENGKANTLTISGSGSTRKIYAKSRTVGKVEEDGSNNNSYDEATIKQYVGPNQPSNLNLSYTKSRLTLKEPWTISWSTPATNNNCPIKGYRIRLYRKRGTGSYVCLPIYREDGRYISTKDTTIKNTFTGQSHDIYYYTDNTATSFTVYPQYYSTELHSDEPDLLPGDSFIFAVTAYTRYGKEFDGARVFKTAEAASSDYNIQNAGVMRVRVNSEWKEGIVWVRTNGAWKEADVVSVRTAGEWKESE